MSQLAAFTEKTCWTYDNPESKNQLFDIQGETPAIGRTLTFGGPDVGVRSMLVVSAAMRWRISLTTSMNVTGASASNPSTIHSKEVWLVVSKTDRVKGSVMMLGCSNDEMATAAKTYGFVHGPSCQKVQTRLPAASAQNNSP